MSQVWLVTGASRGLGLAVARAALEAGHSVVAGARSPDAAASALGGTGDRLLAVELDVTRPAEVEVAVARGVERFGRIDVLVNNAGYGVLGPFEAIRPEAVEQQFATNVFGLMHVTRAVLPIMRRQRAGHLVMMSSIAGFRGGSHTSIYAASKFAVEGLSESLAQELAPFGIRVTILEPGSFRTDFLDPSSAAFGNREIEDYAASTAGQRAYVEQANRHQPGDPAKLAAAVLAVVADPDPPLRLAIGADAVKGAEAKIAQVTKDLDRWRPLAVATGFE